MARTSETRLSSTWAKAEVPEITQIRVERTGIEDLCVVHPKSVTDERGTVREFFRESAFAHAGLALSRRWSQMNLTSSRQGAIRGLHGETMAKLIGVIAGQAFGVYLDARSDSATRGQVVTMSLERGVQVFVPAGVCNGFQATSQGGCEYLYCFDAEWEPGMPGVAVNPLDPALAIPWPIGVDLNDRGSISSKDAAAPLFAEL